MTDDVPKKRYEILNINPTHEKLSEKDVTCAFLILYQNINLLLANRFFKDEIDDAIITCAICSALDAMEEQNHKLHFLLSLVYKVKIKKDGNTFTLVSLQSLKHFTIFEILYIAVERINAVRDDDGFLTFINTATVKKYDSIEAVIKEIYNSDKTQFKAILLDLGIVEDKDLPKSDNIWS